MECFYRQLKKIVEKPNLEKKKLTFQKTKTLATRIAMAERASANRLDRTITPVDIII